MCGSPTRHRGQLRKAIQTTSYEVNSYEYQKNRVMKQTKTYEQVERELEQLNQTMELYDRLVSFGIPKKMVHYNTSPEKSSGYSMGETIAIMCNGQKVQIIDNTQEYARGCKWRAKHGYIVFDFTKKALKEYVTACYNIAIALKNQKECSELVSLYEAKDKLIEQYFDVKNSDVKGR